MTIAEKYRAIVALLKDEDGNWLEDVNGADFVQEVSIIVDAPTQASGPNLFQWTVALVISVLVMAVIGRCGR